jgi:hypothetical protein
MECPYCGSEIGAGAQVHISRCPMKPGVAEKVVIALHFLANYGFQCSQYRYRQYASVAKLPNVEALLSVFNSWDGVAYWAGLVPHSAAEHDSIKLQIQERKLQANQELLADKEAEYKEWINGVPFMTACSESVKPTYDPRSKTWRNRRVALIR